MSPTQFAVHVYCGQMAAWMKMPIGTEVGLGLRNIVFDVDPATPRKKAHPHPPNFGVCLLWPNGGTDEHAAWYGSRHRPRPHCTRRGSSSHERGTAPPPLFSSHVYCGHGRHLSYCRALVHCESKKQGTTILSITLQNVDRFSNFFH